MRLVRLVLFGAACAGVLALAGWFVQSGSAAPSTPGAAQLQGRALLAQLRKGGLVVYFRHAATDMSMSDTSLATCRTQRNLNAQGRADAREIGRAWRALKIPVGQVLSSRYCRAQDTARLAFRRLTVARDLTGIVGVGGAERARRSRALRRLLAEPPARGNRVLVAHLFNIQDAADVSLEEGEAAVFRPRGGDSFELLAKVRPRAWARLAPAAAVFAVRKYSECAPSVVPSPAGSGAGADTP